MTTRVVTYYRVSTDRQDASGLSKAYQQKMCQDYIDRFNCTLLKSFSEVSSGKDNNRPILSQAIKYARATKSKLLVAKLDRLSRDAAFLLQLRDSNLEIVVADMPYLDFLSFGVLATFAQHEREAISARVKAALAAAKARGQKLGSPNSPSFARAAAAGRKAGVKAIVQKAAERSTLYAPIIDDVKASGISTLSGIAAELNKRGIKTPRGGLWYGTSVKNVIDRANKKNRKANKKEVK